MADKIVVTAGPGRVVPVHSSVATAPGAQLLILKPGDELAVDPGSTLVQRALRNGDLVRVEKKTGKPAKES